MFILCVTGLSRPQSPADLSCAAQICALCNTLYVSLWCYCHFWYVSSIVHWRHTITESVRMTSVIITCSHTSIRLLLVFFLLPSYSTAQVCGRLSQSTFAIISLPDWVSLSQLSNKLTSLRLRCMKLVIWDNITKWSFLTNV